MQWFEVTYQTLDGTTATTRLKAIDADQAARYVMRTTINLQEVLAVDVFSAAEDEHAQGDDRQDDEHGVEHGSSVPELPGGET